MRAPTRVVMLSTILMSTVAWPNPAVAASGGEMPSAHDDVVVVTPLLWDQRVNVLRNDASSGDGDLEVCRVEAPDDSGLKVHIWSRRGAPGDLAPKPMSTYVVVDQTRELQAGTYEVRYFACDHENAVPATLSVRVAPLTASAVEGQPGTLRFDNPLREPVLVDWWRRHQASDFSRIEVPASESLDVQTGLGRIRWVSIRSRDFGTDDPIPVGYGTAEADGSPPQVVPPNGHWEPNSTWPVPDQGLAPRTSPDRVVADYYDSLDVPVLANDTDDNLADLGVCRVEPPAGVGLAATPLPWWDGSSATRTDDLSRTIHLDVEDARPGLYTVSYYACDRASLTPGTLTVKVRRFGRPVVRHPRGRAGVVEIVNRGYRPMSFHYYRTRDFSQRRHVKVGPKERTRISVTYSDLSWWAATSIGPLADGRIRHLQ